MASDSEDRTIVTDRTPLLAVEHAASAAVCEHDGNARLRRVADSFPLSIWLIATIECCERFAYTGIFGPLQNYMQYAADDPLRPGGIGLGQAWATFINQSFLLWCFLTPTIGAIVADQYIGRVKTILASAALYTSGLTFLCLSSMTLASSMVVSRLALFLALFLIGLGTGGIKTNVGSLVAEQYTGPDEAVHVTKSGEKVIIDKRLTIQSIFAMFFIFLNVGAVAASSCTAVEQRYGFTFAFALPTIVFIIGSTILFVTKDRFISRPPESSIILHAARACWIAIRNGGNLDKARPDAVDPNSAVPWTDSFIDELKRVASASKIFLLFPFYWAAYSQSITNFVSQAGTMETHGIPNDIMLFLDPMASIIVLPILDRVFFPYMLQIGRPVGYNHRITAGFLVGAAAMFYAAFVQAKIYAAPPCYDHPLSRDCMHGQVPNHVSVLVQAPAYILNGVSAILAAAAGIEYAYTKAPESMKSLVMAVYLSTTSVGSLLAVAVSPLTVDPKIAWMYITLGLGPLAAGALVWVI